MNRTAKSIFAMLIAVAMIFTALPMGALAQEADDAEALGAYEVATPATTNEPVAESEPDITSEPAAPASAPIAAAVPTAAPFATIDYGLYVETDNDKVYKNDDGSKGEEITAPTGFGWDGSTLTLTGFSFTTSAATALYINGEIEIVLAGNNNISSTFSGNSPSYGSEVQDLRRFYAAVPEDIKRDVKASLRQSPQRGKGRDI